VALHNLERTSELRSEVGRECRHAAVTGKYFTEKGFAELEFVIF